MRNDWQALCLATHSHNSFVACCTAHLDLGVKGAQHGVVLEEVAGLLDSPRVVQRDNLNIGILAPVSSRRGGASDHRPCIMQVPFAQHASAQPTAKCQCCMAEPGTWSALGEQGCQHPARQRGMQTTMPSSGGRKVSRHSRHAHC